MLPGFRFLLAAIVLSMSILVFGLGAAALLRATHEQFASTPSWRALPEPKFAQQNEGPGEALGEPLTPMLARLSVEPEPAPQQASDSIPAAAASAEPPATAPTPDGPEKIAALKPQESAPPEAAVPETSMQSEAAPAPAMTPAPASEREIAATEQIAAPANDAVPPASGQASVPALPDTGTATTSLARGDQAAAVAAQPPMNAAAKPNQSVINKRLQARRAKERRRQAQRARLARQAAAQQQAADPFAQPTVTTRSR